METMKKETQPLLKKAKGEMKEGPSVAYLGASWGAFLTGFIAFLVGLWNAEMMLNEKGYYLTVLLFGLFSSVTVQKNVRDRLEKLPVSDLFYGVSWVSAIISVLLLVIGLWNAELFLSEKGFYGMSFTLSLFGAITIQKNMRDSIDSQNASVE